MKKLIKRLNNLLQINEMSMAFHYKDRYVQVCAWVENPTPRDNRYFKYYNSEYNSTATKVARIRIDKPAYVGGNHKERNLDVWNLSAREKQYLIEILSTPSDDYPSYTKWHDILITYNRDNFHISAKDTIEGNLTKGTRNPSLPDYVVPFDINTPIPDYTKL